jgi:MoaA/NifB/PqqE/SkfB family radical SAM enzyme
LRAVFVLTRQSCTEFPAVLRHAEDIGLDELQVQTFLDWGKAPLPEQPSEGCALDERERVEVRAMIRGAARSAKKVRVILPFSANDDLMVDEAARPGQCRWPFDAIWITAAGQVTPCCNLHDPRQVTLGNAFERPLGEIWLGEAYGSFRERYRRNEIEACRTCPINYGQFKAYTYK